MIPECPPNTPGKPYHGTLRDDNGRGLRIQLYEPECGTDSLRGTGTEIRKVIQIHKGPGRSDGCFMIGGGKRGFRKFERWLRRALILDPQPDIKVSVEPY